MKPHRHQALLALLALLAFGCSGDDTGPVPGTLQLTLTSQNGTPGAMVIVVSGGELGTVHVAGEYQLQQNITAQGTHLLIVGDLTAGALASISIPDRSHALDYVASLQQVADRGTFALVDPALHNVTLTLAQ